MANFATPFAQTGPRRNPSSDERANGFPCGPADQTLFNGLFHRIESELNNVITYAGLTPTDADFSQVRQAIQVLIDAATGGGDTETYLTMSQAAARLPIFPEVTTADGRINITSPGAGTVRVPGGVGLRHRGIMLYNTAETDIVTVASRTYHLRWNPTDGFSLKWLGDAGYNPGSLAETDPSFDSTYDDMLLARVATNSSNVATITTLSNLVKMTNTASRDPSVGDAGADGVLTTFNYNFARTPLWLLESTWPPGGNRDSDLKIQLVASNRYQGTVKSWNWTRDVVGDVHNSPGYRYNILAV
jgi:hypothetical protein